MKDSSRRPVRITILGKEYHIVCPLDERDGLLEAARQLESKMDEIRDSGRVFGAERIAVMAALNVTHELLQSGNSSAVELAVEPELNDRVSNLQDRIDTVLSTLDSRS
ncbi:MAG TPA: cell division protein ZapA [Crenotrichaceae bacterium]|nr:cell division protein ZapA [Crenotrichaceae bacterium]